MSATLDLVTDLIRLGKDSTSTLEPTFTAGLSDGLGDRLICFTDPGAASFELLRFNPDLGDRPGFEDALRASVEALGRLDPSLATIRAVERVEELSGLTLVSVRESGRRLSELMPRAGGTAYAVELIREIGPALALLHQAGHAHGALTPERIIVSREGRLVVLEHVVGAALGTLGLSAAQLRSVAGVAAPERDGPVKIDARLDVLQLGFIALSLAAGQRLRASDYPHFMTVLLDQYSRANPDAAAGFRPWLERALQLADRPFRNASEALAAFQELPKTLLHKASELPTAWLAPSVVEEPTKAPTREVSPEPDAPSDRSAAPEPPGSVKAEPSTAGMFGSFLPLASSGAGGLRAVVAALGAIIVLQTVIIAYLVMRSASTDVSASAAPGSGWSQPAVDPYFAPPVTEPPSPVVDSGAETNTLPVRDNSVPASATDNASGAAAEPAPVVPPAPPPPPRPGSVTISSPIELQVFEGGTRLGSTAGPIDLAAGDHALELVNDELGFRTPVSVSVPAGGSVSATVAIPTGRIDINAVPWADVWIDGVAAGQTPLANVSLPIGRHEILFRHPQLGERREVAVVKVDRIARVSAVFQEQR